MFAEFSLGLWLVDEASGDDAIGFCGYWTFAELGPDLQLLYAFTKRHTGRGYATEAATALIAVARRIGETRPHFLSAQSTDVRSSPK